MLPALLAGLGVGAVGAGAKGIQNWMAGKDEEEEAKKAALRGLTAKFQHTNTFNPMAPIKEAPGFAETVVAPMAGAVAQNAAQAGIGEMTRKPQGLEAMADEDRNDTWYRDAARQALGRR